MNYDKLFVDGQEISSFVKNTTKIWEGTLKIRQDGTRVILNENTGTWKRLADLEKIKRVGKLLYEEQKGIIPNVNNYYTLQQHVIDNIGNPAEMEEGDVDDLINVVDKTSDKLGFKKPTDQAEKEAGAINELTKQTAENNSNKDIENNEDPFEEINDFKAEINETMGRLHPSLQPKLKERLFMEDELKSLGRQKIEELKSAKYEDDDYLDIDPDLKDDIIDNAIDMIEDNVEDIAEELKSKYELSDEDAEEYAICAMEKFLADSDIEPRECLESDEIEDDFEETIDSYDGSSDGLLDHLVDEYEIDPSEAEFVYEEKKGNLEECIFAFVDIVRKRLYEKRQYTDKDGSVKIDWDLPDGTPLSYDEYKKYKGGSSSKEESKGPSRDSGDVIINNIIFKSDGEMPPDLTGKTDPRFFKDWQGGYGRWWWDRDESIRVSDGRIEGQHPSTVKKDKYGDSIAGYWGVDNSGQSYVRGRSTPASYKFAQQHAKHIIKEVKRINRNFGR